MIIRDMVQRATSVSHTRNASAGVADKSDPSNRRLRPQRRLRPSLHMHLAHTHAHSPRAYTFVSPALGAASTTTRQSPGVHGSTASTTTRCSRRPQLANNDINFVAAHDKETHVPSSISPSSTSPSSARLRRSEAGASPSSLPPRRLLPPR